MCTFSKILEVLVFLKDCERTEKKSYVFIFLLTLRFTELCVSKSLSQVSCSSNITLLSWPFNLWTK